MVPLAYSGYPQFVARGIFEELLELEFESLQSDFPTEHSYPYPSLTPSGRRSTRSFRAIILENDLLRATVLPELGGRIWSIYDKRSSREIIERADVVKGGLRGATLASGIEFCIQGEERLTSMAAVHDLVVDEESGELWLSESVTGTGLSYHLRLSLDEEAARLQIEGRVFNRTLSSVKYAPKYTLDRLNGSFYCTWPRGEKFLEPKLLAPHQLDTWTIQLSFFPRLGSVLTSENVAAEISASVLRVEASEAIKDSKIVLLLQGGQSIEAKMDLFPERLTEIDLSTIPDQVREFAILNSGGQELLRSDGMVELLPQSDNTSQSFEHCNEEQLRSKLFLVADRHMAHYALATKRAAVDDYITADYHAEQSLLYNGEDHLAWSMRAALERWNKTDEEESAALLNAHFLAPLDPVLRAEGLLRSPASQGRNPLLQKLAADPDELVEVAVFLIDSGLFRDALRWIEESVKVAEVAMLRYLRAFVLLTHTSMEYEAETDIAVAGSKPLAPPYPWRATEKKAIAYLSNRLPDDERLRQLVETLNQF